MAKRKRYPKLPNGFGSIRYLGKNRRNPYGVYPPSTTQNDMGEYVREPALCYVPDYYSGIKVLTLYHDGKFQRGDSLDAPCGSLDSLISTAKVKSSAPTFAEVYDDFFVDKYESGKEYSLSAINSTKSAFKNSKELHNKPFDRIVHADMQKVIDELPLKHASKELLISLYHQMFQYAFINHIIDRDESAALKIKTADDDESGVPFSDEELKILWQYRNHPDIRIIIIMCYSGFRIGEMMNLEINLKDMYFKGGNKTKAGKNRIVPIHSAIQPLVKAQIRKEKALVTVSPSTFRSTFYDALNAIGIERHTPHDTRHTFSRLCEKYGVSERDQKRMLGHSFRDITNKIYGHRELDDLRTEIEKIVVTSV